MFHVKHNQIEHVIANQSADWCGNPVDVLESAIGAVRKIDGIAASSCALPAMTCFF